MTILIVDDHAGFRRSARRLLEAEDFDVVGEAEDGEGALEAVARLHPDIVLRAGGLPARTGTAVARDLAAVDAAPQVVLTSGRTAEDLQPLLGGSSAQGFLPKDELSGAALMALLR